MWKDCYKPPDKLCYTNLFFSQPFKISCEVSDDQQLAASGWSAAAGMEMASVLSNWYGFNIFNVANFIEYEPYPKRRKLDKSNNYLATENLTTDYELVHRDRSETSSLTTRVRNPHVSYRPYSDLHHGQRGHGGSVKPKTGSRSQKSGCGHKCDGAVVKNRVQSDQEPAEGTTIDHLFPEILCLIFEKLDLQSKGRAAQVNYNYFLL